MKGHVWSNGDMVCDLPVAETNDAEDKRISLFKIVNYFLTVNVISSRER